MITLDDLLVLKEALWPHVTFYDKQIGIIESVCGNDETYVPAGNELGKDFVSAFIVLSSFLICQLKGITCRIVTTSVAEHHLKVLWGEIGRFAVTSKYPILYDTSPAAGTTGNQWGSLVINYQEVRRAEERSAKNPLNYLIGRVSQKDEGLAGHHAEFTMFVGDEASGLDDAAYGAAQGWAKRMLIFGNPNDCSNFFRRGVRAGDLLSASKNGNGNGNGNRAHYYRRVIRIKAEDSPNVRLGLAQERSGKEATGERLIPGVLSWAEYKRRRATWDSIRQCVGLDAEFYEGKELLLFPSEWLNAAERRADELAGTKRTAKAIGVDTGEGEANTAIAVVDDLGLLELVSKKTPDTSIIQGEVLAIMRRYGVSPERVMFDRGGGGKQIADRLRADGYGVQTVAFGESLMIDLKRGITLIDERLEHREEHYVYRNRRAEMYDVLSRLMDPSVQGGKAFALPRCYVELRRQLSMFPRQYDDEGRMMLPPKNRKPGMDENKRKTLTEMMGRSPDDADALVLAVHGMVYKPRKRAAGVF